MKKALSVFLALSMLLMLLPFGSMTALAENEGDYTYSVSDGKATITKYTGSGGEVTIPATLGGSPVTEIGSSAFSGCTSLTSVTIPNSVVTIGEEAFYGCSALTGVTIGSGVTEIGWSAFYGCSALTGVTIPII